MSKAVSPFVQKLYEMTHGQEHSFDCFQWSDDGTFFWVSNSEVFSREVLPTFFKHNNYASFVRQLNMYGFRRSTDKTKAGPGAMMVELFRHPYFIRGRPELLASIQRKVGLTIPKRIKSEAEAMPDFGAINSPALEQPKDEIAVLCQLVAELRRRNEAVEAQLAMLTTQNQLLTSQQHQQSEMLGMMVRMMSQMGITDSAPLLTFSESSPVTQTSDFVTFGAPSTMDVDPRMQDDRTARANPYKAVPVPGHDMILTLDDDLLEAEAFSQFGDNMLHM